MFVEAIAWTIKLDNRGDNLDDNPDTASHEPVVCSIGVRLVMMRF